MIKLIDAEKTPTEFNEDLIIIREMIVEVSTIDELIKLEAQVGLVDFLGVDEWEEVTRILYCLKSPYLELYSCFVARWFYLEEKEE